MSEFVIPEGYRKGYPRIQVNEELLNQCSFLEVNYEGLQEMYHEDLEVPRSVTPQLRLSAEEEIFYGRFYPFSRKMDAYPLNIHRDQRKGGLAGVILHEGQHLADFSNHPVKSLTEYVTSRTVRLSRIYLRKKGAIAKAILDDIDSPLEIRARARQDDEDLVKKYQTVIKYRLFNE